MKKLVTVLVMVTILAGCGNEAAEQVTAEQTQVLETEERETAPVEELSQETEATQESTQQQETEVQGETEEADALSAKATQSSKSTGVLKETTSAEAAKKQEAVQASQETGKTVNQTEPGQSASSGASGAGKQDSGSSSAPHTCSWDGGSVTTAATCSSEGVRTYTCTGCGKTRTESIAKTSHNYITETAAATCTSAGSTKTYCSICGNVQSETSTGSPTGHNFVKTYWPSEPSCTTSGYYNLKCTNCGEYGGDGTDPALAHSPVTREEAHATYCNENGVIVTECGVCGMELGREGYSGTEHEWVTGTSSPVWSDEAGDFVTYETTKCARCGVIQ